MSERLHVARIYRVEYSYTTGFRSGVDDFVNLLEELGAEVYRSEDSRDFDVDAKSYKVALENLMVKRGVNDDEYMLRLVYYLCQDDGKIPYETIEQVSDDKTEKCVKYVYDLMKKFYDEADTSSGDIHFSQF